MTSTDCGMPRPSKKNDYLVNNKEMCRGFVRADGIEPPYNHCSPDFPSIYHRPMGTKKTKQKKIPFEIE